MLKKVRQVAMMVNDLEAAVGRWNGVLGLEPVSRANLDAFGLRNAMLPTGRGTYLEILTPTDAKSAGARFIERRGEGLYMVIFEVDDLDATVTHLEENGVQVTARSSNERSKTAFLHPRGLNGAFVMLTQPMQEDQDEQDPPESALALQIRQVVVLTKELDPAVERWENLFGLKTTNRAYVPHGDLNMAVLPIGRSGTFMELVEPASDSSSAHRYLQRAGEGLYLLIFETRDLEAAEAKVRQDGSAEITLIQPPGRDFRSMWLHPRTMNGVFTQLSQVAGGDNPWPPAREWR